MADEKKLKLYKSILGDTKNTIDAIQRYIADNAPKKVENNEVVEEAPADSINRILKAAACEDTQKDIEDFLKRI